MPGKAVNKDLLLVHLFRRFSSVTMNFENTIDTRNNPNIRDTAKRHPSTLLVFAFFSYQPSFNSGITRFIILLVIDENFNKIGKKTEKEHIVQIKRLLFEESFCYAMLS